MVTFELQLHECPRAPLLNGTMCRLGDRSFVEAFSHSAILMELFLAEGRWLIVVYERGSQEGSGTIPPSGEMLSEAAFEKVFREIVGFPNEFFAIECSYSAGGTRVRLLSGSNGTCPIYVSGEGTKLTGSWDILTLARGRSSKRFDEQFLIHAAYRAVYTTRTPYHGVAMMPPCSAINWDGGSPTITGPGPPDPDIDTAVDIDEGRALSEFSLLLEDVWNTRALVPAAAAIELSGGYDSAAVALSFARRVGQGAGHLSILVPNPSLSASQKERIAAVTSACRANCRFLWMRDYLPSYAKLARFPSLYYQSESYYAAFQELWAGARRAGADTVISGHGGDELFPTFQGEEFETDRLRDAVGPDPSFVEGQFLSCLTKSARELAEAPLWSAVAVAPSRISALSAMARHTPLVMQEGLWPLYPLCNVPLVRFCHALPLELRFEKALLLSYIEHSIPRTPFFRNYQKENFLDGDIAGLLKEENEIKMLARDMAVYDLDIVLSQQFRTDVERFYDTKSFELLHHICSILHLEAFLRESAHA
ncbi:hypothetical protein ILFOPFJJ_05447 [Ensifer psoraleae]|uniref:asparagine synthase-related protein n=1 Tax=Sinorhizobium psoraleae TaxID=520838 RepID=UPI0015697ED9|nr:asparagine synthase-related protein [Sinorhizobium psoraleae]NRP74525.1 hypothetical protein [Sinorhizobium psoraleae]